MSTVHLSVRDFCTIQDILYLTHLQALMRGGLKYEFIFRIGKAKQVAYCVIEMTARTKYQCTYVNQDEYDRFTPRDCRTQGLGNVVVRFEIAEKLWV